MGIWKDGRMFDEEEIIHLMDELPTIRYMQDQIKDLTVSIKDLNNRLAQMEWEQKRLESTLKEHYNVFMEELRT